MSETKSKSFFIQYNGTGTVWTDENGMKLTGTKVVKSEDVGLEKGSCLILRFDENGFLDGGERPAVEGNGHLEYWRHGSIHRDFGLAAVSADNYKVKEYWKNGKRSFES